VVVLLILRTKIVIRRVSAIFKKYKFNSKCQVKAPFKSRLGAD